MKIANTGQVWGLTPSATGAKQIASANTTIST